MGVSAAIGSIALGASQASRSRRQNRRIAEQEGQFQEAQLGQQQQQLDQQAEAFAAQEAAAIQQNQLYAIQIGLLGQQANQQKAAFEEASARAERTEQANEEALNRTLQKKPNTSRILSSARQTSRAGVSGTLLTGSGGVDRSNLSLGKNNLLGT